MSFRTDMLLLEDELTNLLSPTGFDVTTSLVTVVTRTWLGGHIDAPVASGPQYTDSVLTLPQKHEVKQITTRDIDNSGGRYEMGDVKVMGIIPADAANPGTGFFPTQLQPVIVAGQEAIYLVTGTHNGTYALRELRTTDPFSYDLILTRRIDAPVVIVPDVVAGEVE